MGTALTKAIGSINGEIIQKLNEAVETYSLQKMNVEGAVAKGLMVAEGIKVLKELLTPDIMKRIKYLENKGIGFKTDKTQGYDESTLQNVYIEACMYGLLPIGNEFNIIKSNLYITKEGFTSMLKGLDDLTDLDDRYEITHLEKNMGTVKCTATWKVQGKAQDFDCIITGIKCFDNSADAIYGKAKRKFKARIYDRITGSNLEGIEGEVEKKNIIDVEHAEIDLSAGNPEEHRDHGEEDPETVKEMAGELFDDRGTSEES